MKLMTVRNTRKLVAASIGTVFLIVAGTAPAAIAANVMFVDLGHSGHSASLVVNTWYPDSLTRKSYGVKMGGHAGLFSEVTCEVDYRNTISSGGCDSVTAVAAISGTTYSYKVRCMSPSPLAALSTHVHCWSYFAP